MTKDPETRLIDAVELRGRLADLLRDGPTTLYRRPPRGEAEAPAECPSAPEYAPLPVEVAEQTQRTPLPALPAPQGSVVADECTSGAEVAAQRRAPVPFRLLALSVCTVAAVGLLVGTTPTRQTSRSPVPGPARGVPAASAVDASAPVQPGAAASVTPPPGVRQEVDSPVESVGARDALLALLEGRRRDAIVAYRRLGAAPAYLAVVRILEREARLELEGRDP